MIDLSALNPQQREAALHGDGPCLVLATAGSGKTRVLTLRAARLIDAGTDPSRILLATFTRKAADEMRARLAVLIGEDAASRVWINTFHGACYRMLRTTLAEMGEPSVELLVGGRQIQFVRDILADPSSKHPNSMGWSTDPRRLLSLIGRAKADLVDVTQAEKHFRERIQIDDAFLHVRFWQLYESLKTEKHLVDFDDLLLNVYKLFVSRYGVLNRWQNAFDYILEDEVQDTMIAQHQIVKLLAAKHRNYFAVGDINQSVYGFRGSNPEHTIMSFLRDYDGGYIIKLPINYRSQSAIVDLGSRIIRHNAVSPAYTLEPTSARGGDAQPRMFVSTDEDAEAEHVAKRILESIRAGNRTFKQIAVLYRVNAQSRALEDAMVRHDIPYVVHGSSGFYDRPEVRDMLAYLQLAHDPHCEAGDEALKRILNVPSKSFGAHTRFLGKAFVTDLESVSRRTGLSLYAALDHGAWKDRQWTAIQDIYDMVDTMRLSGPLPEAILLAGREYGYDAFLAKAEADSGDSDADGTRYDILDQLLHSAAQYDNAGAFLAFVIKQRSRAKKLSKGQDAVQLLTLHRSKGLEWPVVFLAGASQGLLPHKRSIEYLDPITRRHIAPESIQEERRLCYVGVTRAMDQLWISALLNYGKDKLVFSPFWTEGGFDKPVEFEVSQDADDVFSGMLEG